MYIFGVTKLRSLHIKNEYEYSDETPLTKEERSCKNKDLGLTKVMNDDTLFGGVVNHQNCIVTIILKNTKTPSLPESLPPKVR